MATEQQRQKRRRHGQANYRLIRYADDFVVLVTGEQEHAQDLRDEAATVFARVGLRLSPEKTRVVHIDDGFDLLGFTIRRMQKRGSRKCFVYTRPSAKAIATVTVTHPANTVMSVPISARICSAPISEIPGIVTNSSRARCRLGPCAGAGRSGSK